MTKRNLPYSYENKIDIEKRPRPDFVDDDIDAIRSMTASAIANSSHVHLPNVPRTNVDSSNESPNNVTENKEVHEEHKWLSGVVRRSSRIGSSFQASTLPQPKPCQESRHSIRSSLTPTVSPLPRSI